eukprot:m.169205 g.169205  ORF g.169205 m.169205 type:complete len:74 (+) comp38974_c0_seq6:750-971(+)
MLRKTPAHTKIKTLKRIKLQRLSAQLINCQNGHSSDPGKLCCLGTETQDIHKTGAVSDNVWINQQCLDEANQK